MRTVVHSQSFAPYFRDLDIAGSIEKSQGLIVTNADTASVADNDRLMVNKNKQLVIKIQDTLHNLVIEDNEIKFKEI